MIRARRRAIRFAWSWLRDRAAVEERSLRIDRGDRPVRARLVRPNGGTSGLPGWVVLHGVTRPGVDHVMLRRFVRSLAASGAAVALPEVPEWRALDLAPTATEPSVRAGIQALRETGMVEDNPVALMGFSFGAPQVVIASDLSEFREELAGVAAFGGYCHLRNTLRFQMTGHFEWQGEEHRVRPDAYGRWVVAANFLPEAVGNDARDVAEGLRELAAVAGDEQVASNDPTHEPVKRRVREGVAPNRRALFDLFAPPGDREPDPAEAAALVPALAEAARTLQPRLEPGPWVEEVSGPVHLIHGRHDHLIPWSETLRLATRLPPTAVASTTVTGLFGHSDQESPPSWSQRGREGVAFVAALTRLLDLV